MYVTSFSEVGFSTDRWEHLGWQWGGSTHSAWHIIDVQEMPITRPSFLTSPPSFSVFLVSFPQIFKDPDGKIHFTAL